MDKNPRVTGPIRRFHLQRAVDETGVSGTGRVAEGALFPNGWCALVWNTETRSAAFYMSIGDVRAIHGHGGKTRLEFDDCAYCPHPVDDHWMDNCGGCANAACSCTAMGWPAEDDTFGR